MVLNRRQVLFLEGMRFTIDMADLAYRRLQQTLPLMTNRPELDTQVQQRLDSETPPTVSAMLDAWSIIDSLHRLRGLIQAAPGFKGKKKSPRVRLFLESTENVPELRNTVQHLDSAINDTVGDQNWTVFGTLSWGVVHPERNEVTACTFLPGAPQQGASHRIINPLDRRVWHLRVDSITIERSGISVCISDAKRRLESLATSMEENLAKAFAEQIPPEHQGKTHGADLTICIGISVNQEQIVPEGTPDPESEMPTTGESDDEEADTDDSGLLAQ